MSVKKTNPKSTFSKNSLVIGVGIVIVGELLAFSIPGLSRGSLFRQYWGGMLGVMSGLIELLGWVIIAYWIFLYLRQRRKPVSLALCPTCGFQPPLV